MKKNIHQLTTHSLFTIALLAFFCTYMPPIYAQKKGIQVNGIILDTNREPIIGATIIIKGTTTGVISDAEGQYFITVPSTSDILEFKFMGYKTQEIKVGKQININVVMKEDEVSLEEVMVVGYGHQKKASVVGSITTIKPTQLQIGTSRSISNNLAGQLAGIIAIQRSGETGWDNSAFWIRGISSFGAGTSPLVLVDGVERSLNNVDPAEIESFSVLKDASASAMYGVRGANGVILINTKRGAVGRPTVNIRVEQGFTSPYKLPKFLGAPEYMEVLNSINRENNQPEMYKQEIIDNTRQGVDPDLYPNVNWIDEIFEEKGNNTRGNVSVSGGNDFLRYSVVASAFLERGLLKTDPDQEWDATPLLRRYSARSNVDMNITPTTLLRVNIGGYLQTRKRTTQSVENLFHVAFRTPPHVHPTRYSSGQIPKVPQQDNPWAYATQTGYGRYSDSMLETLFSLEQDLKGITKGLKTKINFAFDRYNWGAVERTKNPDYYLPATKRNEDGTLDLTISSYGQQFLGYAKNSDYGAMSTYFEWNTSYVRNFGDHNVEGLFLYNHREYDNGSKLPYRNQGIAGRASYNYANRYIGEFNFGYNGSENFSKGNRFGFFPSVALGWIVSEEKFMERVKSAISKLKLRGSYGIVGNDNLAGRRFAYITTIGEVPGYNWGVNNDFWRPGYQEGEQGVPDLTWEKVAKANLGFELGLFNSFDLQFDIFKERRSDIFMQRKTIPGSAGFVSTPWANYGKVDNKGIDLSLEYNNRIADAFNLSIRGSFTYAHNKILEIDEPSAVIGTARSQTGQSVGQHFGLIADGLFNFEDFNTEGNLLEDIPTHSFGPVRPGDIRYRDINEDGVVNSLDIAPIGGTYDPKIVYGFGVSMEYKGFDFSFFFQGNGKTTYAIGGESFLPGSNAGTQGNIFTNVDDRWTVDNPRQDAFYPRLQMGINNNNRQVSSWWMRNMSSLRLKSIELGYSLPKPVISKMQIKGLRVFATANNPLQFAKFKLWDPELGVGNGMRYPIMKSYSVGLNLNF